MPKRPLSAYNFFFREKRAQLLQISLSDYDPSSRKKRPHKRTNGSIPLQDMVNQISSAWKAIPLEERAKYDELAKEDNKRYYHEMKDFKDQQYDMEKRREDINDTVGISQNSSAIIGQCLDAGSNPNICVIRHRNCVSNDYHLKNIPMRDHFSRSSLSHQIHLSTSLHHTLPNTWSLAAPTTIGARYNGLPPNYPIQYRVHHSHSSNLNPFPESIPSEDYQSMRNETHHTSQSFHSHMESGVTAPSPYTRTNMDSYRLFHPSASNTWASTISDQRLIDPQFDYRPQNFQLPDKSIPIDRRSHHPDIMEYDLRRRHAPRSSNPLTFDSMYPSRMSLYDSGSREMELHQRGNGQVQLQFAPSARTGYINMQQPHVMQYLRGYQSSYHPLGVVSNDSMVQADVPISSSSYVTSCPDSVVSSSTVPPSLSRLHLLSDVSGELGAVHKNNLNV
jgi:hypothetical protein